MKFFFVLLLLLIIPSTFSHGSIKSKEYPPFDGWNNNRANRDAGIAGSVLTRKFPSHYRDGVGSLSGSERPNPREVSSVLMSGESGIPSASGKTAFFAFFSDYVWAEIASSSGDDEMAGCPPEYENIPVPSDDTKFKSSQYSEISIPYLRSSYDDDKTGKSGNRPREQLSTVSSTLDGSNIYGESRLWANQLRLAKTNCPTRSKTSNIFSSQIDPTDCRGELASLNDEGKMPMLNWKGMPIVNQPSADEDGMSSTSRLYLTGLKRANENPFLLTMAVIWFRHHNWLARELRELNSDWSDERVFQEARVRNIAVYQNVIMYEWLPLLLDPSSVTPYDGYKSSASLGVSNLFYTTVPYFTSSMIPPGVYRRSRRDSSGNCDFRLTTAATSGGRDERVNKPALRLCNSYWNAHTILQETDVDEIVLGMMSQMAEKEDMIFVEDLKDYYHGTLSFSRRDAMAQVLQRGRDHGLPDYNTIRAELLLEERKNFTSINENFFKTTASSKILSNLQDLYGNVDYLDPFVGGMLETQDGGGPGEVFSVLLQDQFQRLRDGDRFWFENVRNNLLTEAEILDVKTLKIRDVIVRVVPDLNETSDLTDSLFEFSFVTGDNCSQPTQLTSSMMESCTELKMYDYFTTSTISFAVTFAIVGIFTIACYLFAIYLAGRRSKIPHMPATRKNYLTHNSTYNPRQVVAFEVLDSFDDTRIVEIELFAPNKVVIRDSTGEKVIRVVELSQDVSTEILRSNSGNHDHIALMINDANSYDVVLSFSTMHRREMFYTKLITFFSKNDIGFTQELLSETNLLKKAKTKAKRDEQLQSFIQLTLSKALDLQPAELSTKLSKKDAAVLEQVRLTKEEFSSFMKLKENSVFVEQIFHVADVDKDETISFKEFRDVVVIFTKGTADDKTKLMFRMYDRDNNGILDRDEFKTMIKSMIDIGNSDISGDKIEVLANQMLADNDMAEKDHLDLTDFIQVMRQHQSELSDATLFDEKGTGLNKENQEGEKTTFVRAKESIESFLERTKSTRRPKSNAGPSGQQFVDGRISGSGSLFAAIVKLNEYYSRHIFIMALYILITLGVFAKAFWAVVSNQGSGLVRFGGVTVAIARASGGALAFNFSTLLLTMCRNTITLLRETFLNRYIPFDSATVMHKIVAWIAMFFTVIHVVAHGVNFYEVSTQSPLDLSCLFPDFWYPSDYIPSFGFWCFQTITGITGVILCLVLIIMYVFAFDFCRRAIHKWFRFTHYVGFILTYVFTVLHGSGMLIQVPSFQLYFLGFAVLYVIDKLYSLSRRRVEIKVLKAELLPSNVTYLELKRPANFTYKAGQWVKIACLPLSKNEYHPFTLSSAPCEQTLGLHIRAVGPWTQNIRKTYDPKNNIDGLLPKIYLDGPYGEGHQDWYKYEVSVLIGGGIGVTPFASILKDLVAASQSALQINCKAVYFIWVTRDQKQYEWLTDIIQQVEAEDSKGLLHTHIFITQLAQRFDLRTTMLYLCEKRFQKISGKSLFTGLDAVTHFGRPNFLQMLSTLEEQHFAVNKFGVFSCGPPPMTKSVDEACFKLNTKKGAAFSHHYENF